jgi:hypothetical protein
MEPHSPSYNAPSYGSPGHGGATRSAKSAMPLRCTLGSKWFLRRGAGYPTLRFLKGGIPRSSPARGFSLTPAVPSPIECTDDPLHPPFPQSTRKGWGTQLTQPGCTIHAHAPRSTSGRTSRHNPRNTPSDARRFRGGTWRSEPDANAHIRRHYTLPPCRLCSPCLGSSYIAPVTDMSHAGALEKRSLSMPPNYCISGAVRSVISLSPKARREYAVKPSPSSVTDEEL